MASRGRYAKGAERREEILQSAFDVLSQDGYARASLASIGRAMGIDAAHILYYFPSREALFQEVLQRWDVVRAEVRGDEQLPFSWWVESLRRNETNRGIVQLYISFAVEAASPEHPAHAYIAERFARIERDVSAEVAVLQASARLDPSMDPHDVANLLISVSDGLSVRWLVDPAVDMPGGLQAAIDRLMVTSSDPVSG